ncbi:MAG: decaprenyl-phosphate phosphoribosyltransferase [Candidatus Obscuribacterales bacterium]|nr:decaprenyl-phosphate phosphoribosyltransferase [Candidatus Obscuribacterales bacterium]
MSSSDKAPRSAYIKLLRPRQWTKNLIAFAPALFAGQLTRPDVLLHVGVCVLSLCAVSGSVYVFNDILDVEADRKHPTKCKRPIASGLISVKAAVTVGLLAILVSFLLAYLVRPALCLVILAYLLLQAAYVTRLKHRVILDVFCIASGFVLRALAGAAAASASGSFILDLLPAGLFPDLHNLSGARGGHEIYLSPWFLICTSLGSLFLALEKRRQEFRALGADAAHHRKVLGKYSLSLLDRMEAVIVPSLVTSYCLYCFNSAYGSWMMITIPPVLYGVLRYLVLSERDTSTGSPEEVLLKDRPIQNAVLIWVLSCFLVVYGHIETYLKFIVHAIDSWRFRLY